MCTLDPVVWALASTLGAAGVLADEIGASDCELLGEGALHQPVNALSSLAYVAVGVAIVAMAVRHRRAPLAASVVYALCVAAIGFGSILFHGPQPAGSRPLHDLPILITLVFVVVHDVGLLRRRTPHGNLVVFAVAAAVVGVAGLLDDALRTVLTLLALVAVVGLELIVFRRDLRPVESAPQRRARRTFLVAVPSIVVLALVSYLLGRTGSPVCDEDAAFQFHGLWHALSSLLFGLWWWIALDRPASSPTDTDPRRPALRHD